MRRRTTIELDEELLARAKHALGTSTVRATVEEALRRAADPAEGERRRVADSQGRFLRDLLERVNLEVLASGTMWR